MGEIEHGENPKIYYYIPRETACELVNKNLINEDLKKYDLKPIPKEIIEKISFSEFEKLLVELIKAINNGDKSGSDADREISENIFDFFKIDLNVAGNADFWNGISILNEIICNFISVRWNYEKEKFFRNRPIELEINDNFLRRFVTTSGPTSLTRATLPRIWWSSKLIPKQYQELIWIQQDTIDTIFLRLFGYFSGDAQPCKMISVFLKLYGQYNELYKITNRQEKLRDLIKWTETLRDYVNLDFYADEKLEEDLKEIFNKVFEEEINSGIRQPSLAKPPPAKKESNNQDKIRIIVPVSDDYIRFKHEHQKILDLLKQVRNGQCAISDANKSIKSFFENAPRQIIDRLKIDRSQYELKKSTIQEIERVYVLWKKPWYQES